MKLSFKIHRGADEIGGSCVEVWTENTRILLDFGMPLVKKNGNEFDFSKYKNLDTNELVEKGILPNIKGLYDDTEQSISGVIISHAHIDHYGLTNYINKKIKFYMGKATYKLIKINNLFTSQEISLKNVVYFEKEKSFKIGNISITPYWADHSAFDAYSFLVEANGKSLFYSGDFRSHGRKSKVFYRFTHNAPQNVDYLLLEGTTISRDNKPFKTETEIENELTKIFKQKGKLNLIYTSGQNIDRIISIYKACKSSGKILVVDVYLAMILKALSEFAEIPYPSKDFKDIKVFFSYYSSLKLRKNEKLLYQFAHYKITKEELFRQKDKIVMIVRPSMKKDLEKIRGLEGGNFIYSLWKGYMQNPYVRELLNFLKEKEFKIYNIHTSGHADIKTLKKLVNAIKPKHIVPIHTFKKDEYKKIFPIPILELKDGETGEI